MLFKQRFFCILGISFALLLTGCANERIIDKIQIIQVMAYDLYDGRIKGTAIYPTFQEKGKVKLNTLETVSDSYDDILLRFNTKSSFPIEVGQLRLVMFGKSFAEQGIDEIVYNLSRDPVTGSRTQLAVAEAKAEDILLSTKNVNIPFYLTNKISQNIQQGNLPKINLHLFLSDYYSQGKDPYLPYFIHERGSVKIDGLGLFKKGKYAGYINLRQAFLLKLLVDGTKDGAYKIDIDETPGGVFILLRNLDVTTTYSIDSFDPVPSISIHLTINTQLRDVPPKIHLANNENIVRMEQLIEEHLKKDIGKLIAIFKKYNVDPIGFGELLRAKSRNWDYQRYQDTYRDLKVSVYPKVKIIQTGVGD